MIFENLYQKSRKMKKILLLVILSASTGYLGGYIFQLQHPQKQPESPSYIANNSEVADTNFANLTSDYPSGDDTVNDDFVRASQISTQSVVYIKNISEKVYRMSFMDMFFGGTGQTTQTISSGSGVIYSSDGYIITNNHVVADADKLEVILGKNTYQAKLIGTDPSSDLAVLKIDAKNLPSLPLGSSHDLKVGEWVLAVGNPFNLTSTVTGGIVSAKARALNIVKDKFPIESFIQTDAAINPGNSGGALVNRNGQLVGINTAILSRTGSYAGYGFAVPVDIVKKVVEDIIRYGEVQKAFVGAEVSDLNDEVVHKLSLHLDKVEGVLVTNIQNGWAAEKSGIKEGDIILSIDHQPISSKAEFDEMLSYHSPGDQIDVTWKHEGTIKEKKLLLSNREGSTEVIRTKIYTSEYLGAELEMVPKVERDLLKIDNGVKIKKLYAGGLLSRLDLEEGFIITAINQYKIDDPQKLANVLSRASGRVRVVGVTKDGVKGYYTLYLR